MNKRFEALDAFRGLCALSLVLHHMQLTNSVTELDFFKGSWILVEFFFVLSGFVLAHGYGFKENLRFPTYMKARFLRIYPLHFFMLLIFIVLEFGKLAAYKFAGLTFNNEPFTGAFAPQEIIPNLLLIQSWTPFTNSGSFNFPAWSISVEFYIYALFFVSIAAFKNQRIIAWLTVSLAACLLIYFESKILFPKILEGLFCFFGGAFSYVIYKKIAHLKPSYILGSLGECLLLLLVILITQSQLDYGQIVLLSPLLFFITVVFFAFESGCLSQLCKTNPFQYIGKLSYSIYMTHIAILFCLISTAIIAQKVTGIEITQMLDGKRYMDFGNGFINNLVALAMVAMVILASHFTYKYIEFIGSKARRK